MAAEMNVSDRADDCATQNGLVILASASQRFNILIRSGPRRSDVASPEEAGSGTASEGLQFITITDPSQSNIPRNRRLVRSQAMRFARKRVRPVTPKRQDSRQLAVSPASACTANRAGTSSASGNCRCQVPTDFCDQNDHADLIVVGHVVDQYSGALAKGNTRPLSLPSVLGYGRVDPFKSSSIVMEPYMDFLLDVCKLVHTPWDYVWYWY